MAQSYEKQLAVVTGASSGIGLELARQFAQNHFDLVIAAEDAGINDAARILKGYGIEVEAVQADLTQMDGVHALLDMVGDRDIDAIAINAGVGVGGEFISTDINEELNMIHLNVVSTYHLAKHVAPKMAARGKGRILITASVAATMPAPYEAVYGATKAFNLSLADGLRGELAEKGVTVTALMPGPTETNFFHRAGLDDTRVGQSDKDDPADVAAQGFKALMNGDAHIVAASFKSKMMGAMNEIMPEVAKAALHKRLSEPGSAGKKH